MLHRWAADLAHLPLLSGAVPAVALTATAVVAAVLVLAVVLRVRRGRALGTVFGALSALGLGASLLVAATVLTNLTVTRYPTAAVALGHRPAVQAEGTGRLVDVDVPGTVSHFAARSATVYVPASYDAGASDLPVLVLLTGQPGHVVDWIEGGRLAQTMDDFAARHGGAAPIVVVADGLGTPRRIRCAWIRISEMPRRTCRSMCRSGFGRIFGCPRIRGPGRSAAIPMGNVRAAAGGDGTVGVPHLSRYLR